MIKNVLAAALGAAALTPAALQAAPLSLVNESRGDWTLSTPKVGRGMQVTTIFYSEGSDLPCIVQKHYSPGETMDLVVKPATQISVCYDEESDLDVAGLAQPFQLRDADGVRLSECADGFDLVMVDMPNVAGKNRAEEVNFISFRVEGDGGRAGLLTENQRCFRILQDRRLGLPSKAEAAGKAMPAPVGASAAAKK